MTGKAVLFLLLSLFISVFVFSEDVIMEVKPDPVRKGYQFTVTLYVDHDVPSEVTVAEPEIPEGFKLVRGPAVRSYYVTLDKNRTKKKTRVKYTFLALKTGRFVLDSYRIDAGGREFKTDPVIVGIGLYKNKRFYIPYEVSWEKKGDTFYVGQAVPLSARVENLPDILIFEKVEAASPASGIFTEIEDPGPITIRKVGNQNLYTVPVGGYLFTPSRKSTVKIPGIRVVSEGISSYSRSVTLKILDIPEEARTTGAVGNFTRIFSLEKDSAGVNESINLHVVVEGTGNLNYLEIPSPEAEDMVLAGEKDEENYKGTINGYVGKREKVFTFVSSGAGDKKIIIPPFPFLNPETGEVSILGPESITVRIENTGTSKQHDPFMDFVPEKLSVSYIPVKSGRYKNPESYLWLLPGPLVFLIFFFKRNKKLFLLSIVILSVSSMRLGAEDTDPGRKLFSGGEYKKALAVYTKELEMNPDAPSLYYNLALCYYRLGITDRAVYAARTALMYNPFSKNYSDLVAVIEKDSGIEYPVHVKKSVYPDIFLFLLTLVLNGAAFIGVIYLVRRKNFFFILSVLLAGISIITAGVLIYSSVHWKQHYGIVRMEAESVRKIPLENSEPGFQIKEGETLKIIGSSGDYEFVENGLGLKGWILADSLLVFGGDIDPLKILGGEE